MQELQKVGDDYVIKRPKSGKVHLFNVANAKLEFTSIGVDLTGGSDLLGVDVDTQAV